MRVALIIAPFLTATPEEQRETKQQIHWLSHKGWCPIFLPYALQCALDDHKDEEREKALEASEAFVRMVARDPSTACFQVGNRITEGMQRDLLVWQTTRLLQGEVSHYVAKHTGLAHKEAETSPRRVRWDERDRA